MPDPTQIQRAVSPSVLPPFVIEHLRREETRGGYFTPAAQLVVTPGLRMSGLLAALPAEEARSLLLLLTFLTPNGRIQPTLSEIAAAMGLPERKARGRMLRLQTLLWRGQPLVRSLQREVGVDAYYLAPHLYVERDAGEGPAQGGEPPSSGRSAAVTSSRAAYGRPRSEVERLVARQLGSECEPSEDAGPDGGGSRTTAVRRRLLAYGVSALQADRLLLLYPLERVEQQIGWMAYRSARDPARLLVAAIESDYEPPAYVRRNGAPPSSGAAGQATHVETLRAEGGGPSAGSPPAGAVPVAGDD